MKVKKDVPLTADNYHLWSVLRFLFCFFFSSAMFGWLVCERGWFAY